MEEATSGTGNCVASMWSISPYMITKKGGVYGRMFDESKETRPGSVKAWTKVSQKDGEEEMVEHA